MTAQPVGDIRENLTFELYLHLFFFHELNCAVLSDTCISLPVQNLVM